MTVLRTGPFRTVLSLLPTSLMEYNVRRGVRLVSENVQVYKADLPSYKSLFRDVRVIHYRPMYSRRQEKDRGLNQFLKGA